jgi:hypothetical protein
MDIYSRDREIMRKLVSDLAEVASLSVHAEKAELWKQLNGLDSQRPMVWINEVCWHELAGEELDCQCEHEILRIFEADVRRTLYQWRHFPCDMTVEPFVRVQKVWSDTGFGQTQATASENRWGAKDLVSTIREMEDVQKLQIPEVTYHAEETERRRATMDDLVGDIMPVKVTGVPFSQPRSVWDVLIEFYGIDEMMIDLIDRPELVHAAMDRMTTAILRRHEQYEELGLLGLNNRGDRVGTGGLGWTDELPAEDFDGEHVRMIDCWGGNMAQIFSEVSPAMHEEFALNYELRILERFGLNYYGCCEPLHKKIDLISRIPRLRKISMSPFVNWREGAEKIGERYVYSAKPNPAVLATETWHPEQARKDLRELLDATRGCHVEITMKDVHTLRNDPRRIDEWAELAMDEVERFAAVS